MAELTLAKLKELFKNAAVNKEPEKEYDCVEYNWKKPHHFGDDHQENLSEFANLLMKNTASNFSNICHTQMKADLKHVDQHYAGILINEGIEDESDLFLRFICEQISVGFLRIPVKTAMAWVVHMLGDNEIDPNKKNSLSVLEETLLLDICQNVISALSNSLLSRDAKAVEPEQNIIKDKLTLSIDSLQELYEIAFNITSTDNVISDASLYIYSNHLDTIAGKIGKKDKEVSDQHIDKARQENLNSLYLPVSAQLGEINISLSDLVSLQVGDVIKLDKPLSSNILVKIKNKPAFNAWPVQSNRKYSLLIDKEQEN